MEVDNRLGNENIKSLLVSLDIPAIIGQIINLVYNIVDRMYIGHIKGIGSMALTGVGLCSPLLIIMSAFAVLIGIGGSPRASIKMGEGDKKGAEKIIGNCFSFLIIMSIILTIVFLLMNEKLLLLFGASEKTIPFALEYMNIYSFGIIFVMISIGMNPFISAQGYAKISMITISIGAILNIILDPIFIYLFKMNIKGAALATVISQGVSCLWIYYFLKKKSLLKLKRENYKIDINLMKPVFFLGLSPFTMQISESLLMIAFNSQLQKIWWRFNSWSNNNSCYSFKFLIFTNMWYNSRCSTNNEL